MSRKRASNVMHIADKIPAGDLRQGFVFRDTGIRPVVLIHPATAIGKIVDELNKKGDVYVHQLCPPNTAYIVDRENWPDMERGLDEDVTYLRTGGRT